MEDFSLSNKEYRKIETRRIKKILCNENISLLKVNFEYPQITGEISKSEKSINDFYEMLVKNYLLYCENKLLKKLIKLNSTNDNFKAYGEIIKYHITYNSEKYISVVIEITHFNGYFENRQRYSHIWDAGRGIMLPCDYFLSVCTGNRNKIRNKIGNIIYDQVKNGTGEFSYTNKSVKRYAFRCCLNNYFLTPRGIAFWFDRGTLAPENEGFPSFVIDCEIK